MLTVSVCAPSPPLLSLVGTQSKLQINAVIDFLPSKFNATCSASGQTQTVTREAPTITKAPVHSEEKSPQLDDGDSGFPPCDDDVDGGNWSGGFFLL
ncbi:transcription factor Sp8 [Gossypium australe]|uniref:Transcription factor Sp8 n=1 Tax=Gossypium australe TaxID=47621 RepID=A0A5B6U5P2_9ROSI|nr:transcription factor Sp8 [Gossypium australe]